MKHSERSGLIAFDGLPYAPKNELGVELLFGKIHRRLGFPRIDFIKPSSPDCWAYQKSESGTRRVCIEFEFRSHSFKAARAAARALMISSKLPGLADPYYIYDLDAGDWSGRNRPSAFLLF